jgi:branched-chain amino acid transport system substrate-binding protein
MHKPHATTRRGVLQRVTLAVLPGALPFAAHAADPLKIGLILPLTGPFASTG